MTHLYFIRHGDRYETPPDPELTELGINQARKTGQFLKQFPITKIIASPLKRALQTAEHIANIVKVPLSIDERLRERINFGDQKGQTREEFWQEWIRSSAERNFIPQTGDSSFKTGKKVETMIRELNEKDAHIVLVSHGGTIADFLRNIVSEEVLTSILFEYPEGKDFNIKNCSVTQISFFKNRFTLHLLNCIDHLQ